MIITSLYPPFPTNKSPQENVTPLLRVCVTLIGVIYCCGYCTIDCPSRRIITSTDTSNNPLTWIVGIDGSTTNPKVNSADKARARQQTCFICRCYSPIAQNTQWKCKDWGMPLCQSDRSNYIYLNTNNLVLMLLDAGGTEGWCIQNARGYNTVYKMIRSE
jgi:hypothetical protein